MLRGQSDGVIDLFERCCLPIGLPSVGSGACVVVQISLDQCGVPGEQQASLKV